MAIKEPVSETPATLVADGEYIGEKLQLDTFNVGGDLISTKEIGAIWGKLSPNPAGFGFVKQEFVDSLPVDGVPKVLYLLKVYDKEVLVGYRPYFWNQENLSFERLTNDNIPNYRAKKGEHKQADKTAIEVTEPKVTDPLYAKINRGIKGGEIEIPQPEIPEGGLKWYLHLITLSLATDTSKKIYFHIASNNPNILTINEIIYALNNTVTVPQSAAEKYIYLVGEKQIGLYSFGVYSSYYVGQYIIGTDNKNYVSFSYATIEPSTPVIVLTYGTKTYNTTDEYFKFTSVGTLQFFFTDSVSEMDN